MFKKLKTFLAQNPKMATPLMAATAVFGAVFLGATAYNATIASKINKTIKMENANYDPTLPNAFTMATVSSIGNAVLMGVAVLAFAAIFMAKPKKTV